MSTYLQFLSMDMKMHQPFFHFLFKDIGIRILQNMVLSCFTTSRVLQLQPGRKNLYYSLQLTRKKMYTWWTVTIQ